MVGLSQTKTSPRVLLSWRRSYLAASLLALAVLAFSTPVRAGDLDSAKSQLEKVKMDVENSSWSSFDDDVKSTESFLDGLPDADRTPVQKQLDYLITKAGPALKEYKSKLIIDPSKRELDSAADSLASDPSGTKEILDRTEARLESDDAKNTPTRINSKSCRPVSRRCRR